MARDPQIKKTINGVQDILNWVFDTTYRAFKAIMYGWDGSSWVSLKVDSNGNVHTTNSASSVGDGTSSVTTAGSAVQLPNQSCKRVFIQAHESNTGVVVVGGSGVVAASGTRRGRAFFATQGDWFYVNNLNLLYLDATADNQDITYYYEN